MVIANMQNKKGLTAIISVILLLMMAVSTAAGMYYWLARVQGQQQGSVESFQTGVFEDLSSAIDVVDASYNASLGHLDIFLQNTGNSKILIDNSSSSPTTEWILFDAGQKAICSTNWAGAGGSPKCVKNCGPASIVEVAQIKQVTLNISGSNCGVGAQPTGSVLSFLINFSGKASTVGSFIR